MIKKALTIVLTFNLVAQLVLPTFESVNIVKADTTTIDEEVTLEHSVAESANNLVKNGYFIEHEQTGSFSHLWAGEEKPQYWELRNWGNSNGDEPIGQLIEEDEQSIVKIDLNRTVGFFQYHERIPVYPHTTYNFSSRVKTKDIQTPHTSSHAVSLRIEQFDGGGSLLQRRDYDFIKNHSGESEWIDLVGEVTMLENTKSIMVVLIFGNVSPNNGATGSIWIDSMKMERENIPVENIAFDSSAYVMSKGDKQSIQYTITPNNATVQDLEWLSEDEDVAQVVGGEITALKAGKTNIVAKAKDDLTIEAIATVEVVEGEIPIQELIIEQEDLTLSVGKGAILNTSVIPENANIDQIEWQTSDNTIVSVDKGIIRALQPGQATIQASAADVSDSIEVIVTEEVVDEYDLMRKKWVDLLVPNEHIDLENSNINQTITELSSNAQNLWNELNKSDNRSFLWSDAKSTTNSADVTTNYRYLNTLAKAYATKGSALKGNNALLRDIVSGLEWMDTYRYNSEGVDYNNWWDWQIGSPQLLNNTVAILYDYLTDDQISRYMEAVKTYVPNPTQYYGVGGATWQVPAQAGNLVDLLKVSTVQGALSKEADRVAKGRDHFPVIALVGEGRGNGLYADGSFVDHGNIAYTGTYGVVFLGTMYDMVYLLDGSSYELKKENLNDIYEMILNAFQPVIYRGLMMDMVNGRAISRGNTEDIGHGKGAIERIIQYSTIAPDEYRAELESMIKYWILSNDSIDMVSQFSSVPAISRANALVVDDTILPRGQLVGHNNFANMDRVVHRTENFVFGISMYSSRIAAYEGNMNGENLKGYYTGSGMTYLYNDDLTQYSDDFWPTVDSYRLPGITVDATKEIPVGKGTGRTSPQSWVGGSTIKGLYGTTGMYLDQSIYDMTLKGKKSWFMFNDEVVALGSNITSGDNRPIETIVENRKILNSGDNPFYINGEAKSSDLNWNEQSQSAEWAHLSGNVPGSDIGYYFPDSMDITFSREERTGHWEDINTREEISGGLEEVTRNYLEIAIDHGVNPENEDYAYVLLPNKTSEETHMYSKNPDIEILRNDEKVQAVKEHDLNIIGANFWTNEKENVAKITSHNQASVMTKEIPGDMLEVAVSDPTHNNETITLELGYSQASVMWVDPRIKVIEANSDHIKIEIDVKGAMGESIVAKFNLNESASSWGNHTLYEDDFEAGKPGNDVLHWDKFGEGQAYYQRIDKPLYSQKDFTGVKAFNPQSDEVVIEYDFIALSDDIDAVMGHGGSDQTMSNYPDIPIVVRATANNGGFFDARDYNQFTAENTLAWEEDTIYHVRLEVDLDNQTYNAFVTPENKEEVQIASDYRFRDSAQTPEDIGRFILQDNKIGQGSKVFNYHMNGENLDEFTKNMEIKSNSDEHFYIQNVFEPQQSRLVIDWSFMKETLENDAFILLGDEQEAIHLQIEGDQLIDQFNDQVIISSIEPGVWYDLSLDVNIAKGTYSVYANGDLVQAHSDLVDPYPAIDTFRIDMDTQSTSVLKIDDIHIQSKSVEIDTMEIENQQNSLMVGEVLQLSADVKPSHAYTGGMRWESSDASILTIDNEGLMTAVNEGTAIVTVIDRVTGISDKQTISVYAPEEMKLDNLKLSADQSVITLADQIQLHLQGYYSDGQVADLNQAEIMYKSNQTNDITITEAGEVSLKTIPENVDVITIWANVTIAEETIQSNEISLTISGNGDEISKKDLQLKVDEAKMIIENAHVGKEPGQYPQSAVNQLRMILSEVEAILNEEVLTQEDIVLSTERLNHAIIEFKSAMVQDELKDEESTDSNKPSEEDEIEDNDVDETIKDDPGSELPNTATHLFNLLVFGVVLFILGFMFLYLEFDT